MKITIESTTELKTVNGIPCRLWEGQTESGITVHCLITQIAVQKDQDVSQFERELQELRPPSPEHWQVFPARMVI